MGVDIFNGRVVISGCGVVDTKTPTTVLRHSSNATTKRCLFGPVDHEEVMSFFRRELIKLNLEKIRKWNFDFVAGRPLCGDFEWRKVSEPAASARAKVTKMKTKRSPLKTVKFCPPNTLHDDGRKQDVKRGDTFVDCSCKEDASWTRLTNNLLGMTGEKNKNFDQ